MIKCEEMKKHYQLVEESWESPEMNESKIDKYIKLEFLESELMFPLDTYLSMYN